MVIVVLTGCSGVPSSSRPEVVRTVVGHESGGVADTAPKPGDEPRAIVSGFLAAAVSSDARHSGSRQFLTADAGGKWQDSTVIIVNDYQVQLPDTRGDTSTVTVTGQRVGQLDARGIFSPELKSGGVGESQNFTFGLTRVTDQWRIDQLQPGVLIKKADFQAYYRARPLYFYDTTESILVPDLRYSALPDESLSLAEWIMSQILAGPRPELAQSVQNEVPDQIDSRRVTVKVSDRIMVELPGSSQIDGPGRFRLAAQLAYTLGTIPFSTPSLTLTDAGQPVDIPNIGPVFSVLRFPGLGPDSVQPAVQPYYLRAGGLISGIDDKPLGGALGNGGYALTSVALRRAPLGDLRIVALSDQRVLLGSGTGPLSPVKLPAGEPSRPDWLPRSTSAYVGVHGNIYAIDENGRPVQVSVPAALGGGLPAGVIVSLRFSPDGVRLAVLLRGVDGTSAVWLGSIVRSANTVTLESFEPETPAALAVTDVTWSDATNLLMIATRAGDEQRVWSVQSDGSYLQPREIGGLPRGLQGIAAAPGQDPLVATAGPAIWVQSGSGWGSLSGTEQTVGYSPTFAP
jgi:hypothetical protein